MKTYFILIAILLIRPLSYSQSKKELSNQVITLTSEKQKLMDEILDLKQQIVDLKTDVLDCKSENIRLQSSLDSKNSSSNNTELGLIQQNKNTTNQSNRCKAITSEGTQCTRNAEPGSKYCWQHKKTYEPASTSNTTSKNFSGSSTNNSSPSNGRTIYTGPRGGKYYINSNGKKTYVKH
jgi:colicin import membrane protein